MVAINFESSLASNTICTAVAVASHNFIESSFEFGLLTRDCFIHRIVISDSDCYAIFLEVITTRCPVTVPNVQLGSVHPYTFLSSSLLVYTISAPRA